MRRRYVLAGLGLVGALALTSTALGGPSLNSLIKNEVAKQLSAQTSKKKGKRGPRGPQGAPGANGINGAANVTYRRVSSTNTGNGATTFLNAQCQSGERLIGGGAGWVQQGGATPNYDASDQISASGPGVATSSNTATPIANGGQPNVWHGSGKNESGADKDFVVYAVCATP